MSYDAVVFDLDGVLVDSEIWWDEVRIAFARANGRDWSEDDRAAVMGQNSRQWSRTMRERLGLDLDPEAIERAIVDGVVARYRAEGAPLIPGAVETARLVAAALPVAIASSAHREVIDAALASLGLSETFPVVVSSDEVARGKPEPDVYLEAARRLGARPERCLVVEDSLNGVKAARAAGMTVVLVPNASVPPAPGAHELASHVAAELREVAVHLGIGAPAPARRAALSSAAPSSAARSSAPRSSAPRRPDRRLRYRVMGTLTGLVIRSYLRIRVVGRDRLPAGPAILCFSHQSWADPLILAAGIGLSPRLSFFGPREADMTRGWRNLLMAWSGVCIPFPPGTRGLVGATRQVGDALAAGHHVAVAGEGRIHLGERELLPISGGPAYFALRFGVPLIPVAINGTGWLALGRTIRITACEPLATAGPPDPAAVEALTARLEAALREAVADFPDRPAPGPVGRWLTELFNDWPGGSRRRGTLPRG